MRINKYYGIYKGNFLEEINYFMSKTKAFTRIQFTMDENKKQNYVDYYNNVFKNDHDFLHRSNAIDEGKYYIPVSFIASDIIPKEQILDFKKGFEKLITNCSSHKFISSGYSRKDLEEYIEDLNDYSGSIDSFFRFSYFDFDDNKVIKEHVDYLEIVIRNFSTSYFAIEVKVFLAEPKIKELIQIIDNDYKAKRGTIIKYISKRNVRKITGKIDVVARYNNAHLKSEIISNKLIETKWLVFNELNKYIKTYLHNKNIIPPSINIFKTNISYLDEINLNFWDSVGVNRLFGEFINPSIMLFYSTRISSRKNHENTDMILVANESTDIKKAMYYDYNFQITEKSYGIYDSFFRVFIMNQINDYYLTVYSKYRNEINKLSISRIPYRKTLKIRYKLELEFDIFRRLSSEIDWDNEIQKIEECFINYKKFRNKEYVVNHHIYAKAIVRLINKIKFNQENLIHDIEQKLTIARHKNDYKYESKNFRINRITVIITILTFIMILYPSFNKYITNIISLIWSLIKYRLTT